MIIFYCIVLFTYVSLSLMPSDLSAPEGDLVQRRTDLEGVLDRKSLTIQAIGTSKVYISSKLQERVNTEIIERCLCMFFHSM